MTAANNRLLRWGVLIISAISISGVYAFDRLIVDQGWVEVSPGLRILRVLLWVAALGPLSLSLFVWLGGAERIAGWLQQAVNTLRKLGRWLWLFIIPLSVLYPALILSERGVFFSPFFVRLTVFIWLLIGLSLCLVALWSKPWQQMVVAAALVIAVIHHLATYFPHVTNYPFALWWSETTRYYLASTFFDQRIYGQELPWVFRDLSRYLIQAVPFLVPGTPIWLHRLWQVILRFSTGYLTGAVLGRRLNLRGWKFGLFTAWAGLYFFQGPVFYNLIVIAIVVFWLVDVRRFWKSLLIVILVSIYAGFSRINWVPMAGLMAALLYFIEVPAADNNAKGILRYLAPPVVWVLLGLAVGLGAQQFWVVNSGNPPEIYFSSFTSYMLWDRLLPNPSYPIGILPYILLIVFPLLLYIIINLRKLVSQFHFIRLLAIAAITGVLFAGGLVVSAKIGGGTNLHNMDVFFVALLIICAEIYYQKALDETGQVVITKMPDWLKAAAIAVPVIFVISFGGPQNKTFDQQSTYQDLAKLQKYSDQAVAEGGEVLFMSQRHLLTFDLIQDVPLVHPYEKMLLQEMAMSNNDEYLDAFAEDMAEQKYALIVSDRLPGEWRNPQTWSLAMENNVVFEKITPRITCAYQLEEYLVDGGLAVWTPKAEVTCPQGKE